MQGEADEIAGTIVARAAGRPLLLLCDFDGTLCEFDPDPSAVFLPDRRRNVLNDLVSRGASIGIVSGRRIEDIRSRVGDLNAAYLAGFHGFEIDGPRQSFVHPSFIAAQALIREAAAALVPVLRTLPGVFIEDKGLSLALHYRDATAAAQVVAQSRFSQIVRPAIASGELRILPGSCVVELLPNVAWHKGSAVRWIREDVERARGPVATAYIGDDVTDEDAFAVLGATDTSVGSSDRVSVAEFGVAGPSGVEALLRALCSKLS